MIDLGDNGIWAEIAADTDPLWVVRIRAAAGYYFGGVYANCVYFSAQHSWGATMWSNSTTSVSVARLDFFGDIEYSIRGDERGGIAEVATATFKLANVDGGYDQLLRTNGYYFDGRQVEIYVTRKSETNYARAVPVFSGMIVDTKVQEDVLEFRCESIERLYRLKLPPRTYQAEDPNVWTADQLGAAVAGKAIPAVFGRVNLAEGYVLSDAHDDGSQDCGRLVNFCDISWGGGYGVGGVNDLLYGDEGLRDATGGTAWINNASGKSPWVSASAGASAYFTENRPQYLYLRGLFRMRSWMAHHAKVTGVTDHKKALDGDPATYAYVPPATDSTTDPTRALMFKIPDIGLSAFVEGSDSTNCTNLQCFFVGKIEPEANAAKWNEDIYVAPYNWRGWGAFVDNGSVVNAFGTYTPCFIRGGTTAIDNTDDPAHWEDYQIAGQVAAGYPTASYYDNLDDFANGFFGVGVGAREGATDCGYARVYAAALYMKFRIDWPSRGIMADMDGYLDSTGGLYTGTADLLVENPAHLIAYIWGEFSKAGNGNVNITEARQVAAERAGWKFGRQLTDQEDVDQVLAGLCEDALLWTWLDSRGKARVFAMTAPRGADGGLAPAKMFTLHRSQVVGGLLARREQSPCTDVKTSFTFRYRFSPAIDDYEASLFCRYNESSAAIGATYEALCAAAKTRYTGGVEYDETYELPWVRDDATAASVAKALIARDTVRRWSIQWDADLGDLAWELGDPFTLDHLEFSDLPIDLLTTAFRVTGKRISPENCRIRFTATEVF